MNLTFYKELVKELAKADSAGSDANGPISPMIIDAGLVEFEVPEPIVDKKATWTLPFYIEANNPKAMCGYLADFVDGDIAVVISQQYFVNADTTRLMAVIAHEVGHYILGHHKDSSYGRQLNVRTERLETLSRKAGQEDASQKDHDCYVRAAMFSLLRGGCLVRETEADTAASIYVPVNDLILVHSEDLDHPNPAAVLEKKNRLVWLNKTKETEPSVKLPIKLLMRKTKAKKVGIDVHQTSN